MNGLDDLDWIAVDWGTTHLRAWGMSSGGEVLAQASSDDGMGRLDQDGFEPALLALIDPWMRGRIKVLACGMVGAKQGWVEAPYQAVPAKPSAFAPMRVTTARDLRLDLWIVPGLSQSNPPDVMRGEETQIAGAIAMAPNFDGVLTLPGTHTKWVHISAEEVVSFQTFMSGEMFSLLAEQSVLRHSVAGEALDEDAFLDAVADSLSRPERLAARLFSIMADATLNGATAAIGRARLSGHLIGAELAATRPYWLGQEVIVAGAESLAALYGAALSAQGVSARVIDADPLTLRGLTQLRATLPQDTLQ